MEGVSFQPKFVANSSKWISRDKNCKVEDKLMMQEILR
jgi:hypothetical protein